MDGLMDGQVSRFYLKREKSQDLSMVSKKKYTLSLVLDAALWRILDRDGGVQGGLGISFSSTEKHHTHFNFTLLFS